MTMIFKRKLPVPEEIKALYPVSGKAARIKVKRDAEIRKIFTGISDKFLIIVGPCSADKEKPVLEYVYQLSKLQELVADKILIIPRIYTCKPRTMCEGYMGMLYHPDPVQGEDILEGILSIRKLHLQVLEETGFVSADEMLYPENYRYISDILSYIAIGARSVENQAHRLTASGLDIPAGIKNPYEQVRICKNIVESRNDNKDIRSMVKGVMIESYLIDGKQISSGGVYGQSITDSCLGWSKTKSLILEIADIL